MGGDEGRKTTQILQRAEVKGDKMKKEERRLLKAHLFNSARIPPYLIECVKTTSSQKERKKY